jgi:hypothetical protein
MEWEQEQRTTGRRRKKTKKGHMNSNESKNEEKKCNKEKQCGWFTFQDEQTEYEHEQDRTRSFNILPILFLESAPKP